MSSQISSINLWPLSHYLQCTGCNTCGSATRPVCVYLFLEKFVCIQTAKASGPKTNTARDCIKSERKNICFFQNGADHSGGGVQRTAGLHPGRSICCLQDCYQNTKGEQISPILRRLVIEKLTIKWHFTNKSTYKQTT